MKTSFFIQQVTYTARLESDVMQVVFLSRRGKAFNNSWLQ